MSKPETPASTHSDEASTSVAAALPGRAALSIAAIALMIVHVVWPSAGIDAIAVALLLLAALPWLLPWLQQWLKSIEVGGFTLVMQEIQRVGQQAREDAGRVEARVERLADRVERAFAFSGEPLPDSDEERLDRDLERFAQYLRGLGVEWDRDLPRIVIMGPSFEYLGLYEPDANELHLSVEAGKDGHVALKELGYYAFHGPLFSINEPLASAIKSVPIEGPEYEAAAILSGLATYLAASFRDDNGNIHDWPIPPYSRGASDHMRIMGVESAGMQWAQALWDQRGRSGGAVDRAAVSAWLEVAPETDEFAERFTAAFLHALGSGASAAHELGRTLDTIRSRRGT